MCYVGSAMNEATFKLPHAPIVEAVLDIECDLPHSFQLSDCQEQAGKLFLGSYPIKKLLEYKEIKIKQEQDAQPEHSVRQGTKALQFYQRNEKQLVQIKDSGYSFNRLAPYTSLDDYLPEIESTWKLFVGLVKPVQIRSIRLRFINRIMLPLDSGEVDLDSYFVIAPRSPEEDKFSLTGFLIQYAAVESDTGNPINSVLTAQQIEGNKLPVILDNTVSSTISCEIDDWSTIQSKIFELRGLKNRIFRKALTQKCIDLFQQR